MDRRNQVRNFPHLDHPFCLDNRAPVNPAEYITNNGGRNSVAFSNSTMRLNGHLPLNFSRDTPYSGVSNSASSHTATLQSAHQTHHLQPSPNSNGILPSYAQHSPSPYYRQMFAIRDGLAINTQQEYGRIPSKRKHPNTSTTYETVDSNGFHTGASSSEIPVSSGNFHQNSMSDSLLRPWEHSNMIPSDQPNRLIEAEEGWQRNVMNRPNNALDLNRNLSGSHLPHINPMLPGQDRRAWNLSGNRLPFNQQMPSDQFHTSGDFHSRNPVQQIHNSHRGTLTSGSGAFNCETSQPFVQHNDGGSRLMMDGRHHGSIVPSRSQNGPPVFSVYGQRTATDRSTSNTIPFPEAGRQLGPEPSLRISRSLPMNALSGSELLRLSSNRSMPIGGLTSSEEGRQLGSETFGRSSRPSAIRGPRNSGRRGWNRNSNGELQSLPPFSNGSSRRMPEVQLAVSQSSFHDPRRLLDLIEDMGFSADHINFEEHLENANRQHISTFYDRFSSFDQHANMRLDVDNMSYEELLALGERIGNVDAGISVDKISSCVKEMAYRSPEKLQEEEADHCAICLEDYDEEEKIGILQCRHEYHLSCIKQWLQRKTTCPICKSSVLEK